jgi:ABC-2 type transport system ATP-binding protein
VRVLGRDPRRDRAGVRRHVGVLLQHSGLSGDLTVRETLQTWARTLTDPPPVAEALEQVDLAGRADVRVRSLSGGERRRLDLALALLGRPRVVVLDEPTTGLDPESRRAVWVIVRALVGGGAAVIIAGRRPGQGPPRTGRRGRLHRMDRRRPPPPPLMAGPTR